MSTIEELALQSLRKWQNDNAIFYSPCSFCRDASITCDNDLDDECRYCRCPPALCHDGGSRGLVGKVFSAITELGFSEHTSMKRIPQDLRLRMLIALRALARRGA